MLIVILGLIQLTMSRLGHTWPTDSIRLRPAFPKRCVFADEAGCEPGVDDNAPSDPKNRGATDPPEIPIEIGGTVSSTRFAVLLGGVTYRRAHPANRLRPRGNPLRERDLRFFLVLQHHHWTALGRVLS